MGLAQVTFTNLNHTKKVLRPKVLISENVLTGTVTNRIMEEMKDMYDSEDKGVKARLFKYNVPAGAYI